jgi:hypothetical protein
MTTASSARLYRKLEGKEFVTTGFDHVDVVTPGYGHTFCASSSFIFHAKLVESFCKVYEELKVLECII